MEVPCYQEISVKNLYEDAMKDEVLVKYLPTPRSNYLGDCLKEISSSV